MAQIAAELGISATGLSLNDSRVRELAVRPSGAISMSDLYGKTFYPKTDYTITFAYDSVGNQYICNVGSGGGYGSLTPDHQYKGNWLPSFKSLPTGRFEFTTVAAMPFAILTINGVVMDRNAALISTANSYTWYEWNAQFTVGPYAMTIQG